MIPDYYPVACHTDNVGHATIFVVIQGTKLDGLTFVPLALEKGARAIVIEESVVLPQSVAECIEKHGASVMRVSNARRALAELSAQAVGYPARKLKIIGITGTKGKSTTTFLTEHIMRAAGLKVAMLSTVKNCINGVDYPTKLTTQQPDYLHVFFNECVKQGVEYVVMEVAAQAFSLHRVEGILFDIGVFTNFSQEHGEFYATMQDYFNAKCRLIDQLKSGAPLFVNPHDVLLHPLKNRYQYAHDITPGVYTCPALIGSFNDYNVAAAAACAQECGISSETIQQALNSFTGVPGRLEKYQLPNGAIGIIDYAHNPSSYAAVLGALRPLTKELIVVFGCGGDRDASKRPLMGKIASEIADKVVLTADNPRTEKVQNIIHDILSGILLPEKVIIEYDRTQAIKKAYEMSHEGSFIVLLGKGPDEYQIIDGVTYPLSEKAILKSLN